MPTNKPKPYSGLSWEQCLRKERNISSIHGVHSQAIAPPTPSELRSIYDQGYVGASKDLVLPTDMPMVERAAKARISLYQAFPWLKPGTGRGKKLMPYQAALSVDPTWGGDESQTVGSCVSHGCRNAGTVDYGIDALFGETTWQGRICTENIYRHRGKNSHGWWCSAAAATVEANGKGGFLYRKKYVNPNNPRDEVDLTTFSSRTEQWASNGAAGVPQWLQEIENENQAAFCIPVTTIEEFLDALYLGFGVNVCSGTGFSSRCDQYGVAKQSGSWSHAMAHVGADDTEWAHRNYDGMISCDMQSWGRWNNQNGLLVPPGFEKAPIGSFFVQERSLKPMIRSDAYAICSVEGWDRNIPIEDFVRSSEFQDRIHQRQKEREKHGNDIKHLAT